MWIPFLLVLALHAPGAGQDAQQHALSAARAHRAEHGAEILASFRALLAMPNVASDTVGIRRNARELVNRFERRGFELEAVEIEGAAPLIIGRRRAAGATRTLGLYVHYDGQPVSPERWTRPPWQPTLFTRSIEDGGVERAFPEAGEVIDPEWRIYARSAGDDKAPIAALEAALDALDDAGIGITSNIVLLLEGEEEAGSPFLRDYLEAYRERLDADLWLFLDGPVHQSRTPQLVFGVRGITSCEITVFGAERNLHSGHYGNWAPNPGMLLAQLLASMKDADGRVLIEGFHDAVRPLNELEREAVRRVPDIDASLKAELGLARTEGGARLEERLLLPSLNVRGLRSAEVGAKARNVIPNTATAALDIRLVADCVPERMLELVEEHVRAQGFFIVRDQPDHATRLAHPRLARITRGGGYRAARTPMDLPRVGPLVEAVRLASTEGLILMPTLGGSLPLYLIEEVLGRPFVIVPIANHDDNQHAPDENLRLANLWYGIDLFAAVLTMP